MKLKSCLFLFTMFFFWPFSQAKILIFTYSYNRPDFIEMQHKTFKKFLSEEYDFVVFNDARDARLRREIQRMCMHLEIKCIPIPQEIHDRPYLPRLPGENYNHPTVRNCNVVQYSLDVMGFAHDDILVLFDSDAFLVKPLNVREFMRGYGVAGMKLDNGYVEYLWHGLAFLDMASLPNKRTLSFNCGKIDSRPIDAGGYSYYYFKDNPSVLKRYVDYYYSGTLRCDSCRHDEFTVCVHNDALLRTLDFDEHQIAFLHAANNVEFFHNNTFMHYRGGTNWDGQSAAYHERKSQALSTYIDSIIALN